MMSSLIIGVILFIGAATSVVKAGANGFMWRGNVLKLKRAVHATGIAAPLKVPTVDAYLDDEASYQAIEAYGKEYPLLPEEKPEFPGHRQLVLSNEMKFRELMADAQNMYSNELIRCYVDQQGGIERIGLLCRVVERKSFHNGQAAYIIESLNLIQIDGMTVKPGRSYLSSTKTRALEEEVLTDEEIDNNEQLCRDIFANHKIFLRLGKLQLAYEAKERGEENVNISYLCLTPATVCSRPGQKDYSTNDPTVNTERHRLFSYAITNRLTEGFGSPEFHQAMLTATTSSRLTVLSIMTHSLMSELKAQIHVDAADPKFAEYTLDIMKGYNELVSTENDSTYEDLADWKDLHIDEIKFDKNDPRIAGEVVESHIVGEETDDEIMQ